MVRADARTGWLSEIAALKRKYPLVCLPATDLQSPYGLILETAKLLDDDAIITTDVGQHQMWTAQVYPFRRPRRWLTSGGLGTMGFGLPAAIGAALAEPTRRVVCFSGDGSLMMNLQELATAVEEDVDVKIVVLNNNSLGLVHQQQQMFYGRRSFASNYGTRTDFVALAAAFGMRAYDLASSRAPHATLAEAISGRGPALVHAPIDVEQRVLPMVPPGAANREMVGGEAPVDTCA